MGSPKYRGLIWLCVPVMFTLLVRWNMEEEFAALVASMSDDELGRFIESLPVLDLPSRAQDQASLSADPLEVSERGAQAFPLYQTD